MWTHLLFMKRLSTLRTCSAALAGLPSLSQTQISNRWQLHSDTVRRVLREYSIRPAPGPWKRPRYAITDVWRVEGVSHAEMLDQAQHPALLEPLLTGKDLAEELGCVPATIRNYARDNIIPSLRIGGSIRFRKHQIEGLFDAE